MEAYNCDYVCGVVARLLIKAGYTTIDKDSPICHEQILSALSDYSEKRDEMLEYILLEEHV